MSTLYLVITLIVAVSAQPIEPVRQLYDSRVVGGENAEIETYPYQISLQFNGRHICGGSIISENYILTAGHCYKPISWLTIRAGTAYHKRGGIIRKVEKFIQHEDFEIIGDDVPVNDVAVIKVNEPFVFNDVIQPVDLFEVNEESIPGVNASVTGWGYLDEETAEQPAQLQVVTLPIIRKDHCDMAYRTHGGLIDGQICAGYEGIGKKDACLGDSGGPLIIDGRQAGIVSWGEGCARPEYPGVYAEVAHFREWINEHAELH